jgi:ribonuclease-3
LDKLDELQKCLGYRFKDKTLILEALTHKSYKKAKNNERLEFLGDAVLDLVVGEYLFHKFPNIDEGKLSKMRASLVNEEGFKKLALRLNLGKYLLLSAAEEHNKGREKPSLLSNAYEALMGAVYLETGLDKVKEITHKLLEEVYPKIDLDSIFKDYKTTLQEFTQEHFGVIPEYKMVSSKGPDHKKEFEMAVFIGEKEIARATGKSKKSAHQKVAQMALERFKKDKRL